MKRFTIFFLIIAAIAVMTSCASTKGVGKGSSTFEQIAQDKADINAMVDIARQNKSVVTDESKMKTTDVDGKASTVYEDTRTFKTSATLTNIKISRTNVKHGKAYNATSKANATIVEE